MLILGRRIGEIVKIGDNRSVEFTGSHNNIVHLKTTENGLVTNHQLHEEDEVEIGNCVVAVLSQNKEVRGGKGQIRLGFAAPDDVPILRSEIIDDGRRSG